MGPRKTVEQLVRAVKAYDQLEQEHINDVLGWIRSGEPIFRISKPANPPKHLVSYFVPYDSKQNKLMLIDHAKAQAWLPPGGHVDIDEDPRHTVVREAEEELRIKAKFHKVSGSVPLFVTVTTTKGYGFHTDVSLWFVIEGDSSMVLDFDQNEMNTVKWLSPDEVLAMDISELDPHLHRFTKKLRPGLFPAQTLA